MKKIILSALSILLSLSGCMQAIDIDPASDEPVFSLQTNFDGSNKTIEAGRDSFYLFTDYEGNGESRLYTGRLSPDNCIDNICPGSIAFEIAEFDTALFLSRTNLPFVKAPLVSAFDIIYPTTATPTGDLTAKKVFISLGPNSNQGNNIPLVANLNGNAPSLVLVGEQYQNNGLKTSLQMKYLPSADSCQQPVVTAAINDNQVSLSISAGANQQYFTWSNGSTQTEVTMPYDINTSYAVTITSFDYGCSAVATLSNIPNQPGLIMKSPQIQISNSGATTLLQQPGIQIKWVDQEGRFYSSSFAEQSLESYFTITKVEDYLPNTANQPTQKLFIDFRCWVKDSSAVNVSASKLLSGSGVIGVAVGN